MIHDIKSIADISYHTAVDMYDCWIQTTETISYVRTYLQHCTLYVTTPIANKRFANRVDGFSSSQIAELQNQLRDL